MMAIGRPREFEPDEVLEIAMTLFWEHGYDGVSITDLTTATSINRRSLYATFGSKEQLFYKSVDRYLAGPGGFVAAAMAQPAAWDIAYTMAHGAADAYTDPNSPRGCLLVQGALASGEDAAPVQADLAHRRAAGVKLLAERFARAQDEGELPGVDPLIIARWINAVCQGISIQACSGATREELHAVADQALKAWPST
jgi:AcrR family transcriptional regulator